MYDDDRDALAAEYVLGTLSADERDQAEALLAIDPGFAKIVRVWERRLGELNVMVEAIEPPAQVWDKIKTQIERPLPGLAAEEEFTFPPLEGAATQTAAAPAPEPSSEAKAEPADAAPAARSGDEQSLEDLLGAPPAAPPREVDDGEEVPASSLLPPEPKPATDEKAATEGQSETAATSDLESDLKAAVLRDLGRGAPREPLAPPKIERGAEVIILARSMRRWRRFTAAMTAIAALLAIYIGVSQFAPGLIPANRPAAPAPAVTAQAPAPAPSRLVAVLQQDPTAPAFLVSVDPQTRMLTVRRVSAAPEPGRSYELWLISNKYSGPRSLGVVGANEFTARPLPTDFDADTIRTASYAISLEPAGGSPSGAPTGPVLFKGRMVEALPGSPG
jgi:anti-sigma-K factor RskA